MSRRIKHGASAFYRPDIRESEVVGFIQQNLGGRREVSLGYGYADLVIGRTIIEAKKWDAWKELLGQMLVHQYVNPHRPIRGIIFCRQRTFPPYNKSFVQGIFKHFGFKLWVVTDEFVRKRFSGSLTEDPRQPSLAL